MKFIPPLIAVFLAGFILSVSAQQEPFTRAQTAYDDGHYAEAILLYESLLDQGVANPELHYNLANACFKNSDLPKAIWHYRKAGYTAPRDPDIRANLHFALNATGAIEPTPDITERFFSALSFEEWLKVALGGYLLLILLLMAGLLLKSSERSLLKRCLLPTALLLMAAGGIRHWKQLQAQPEWVVVKTEATALFGPVEGSTAHYQLPLGALVKQHSTDPKGWIEIEYDGKHGWLKTDYIKQISP